MIYIKRFLFYARINGQFKTTKHRERKCREVGGANSLSLSSPVRMDSGMYIFVKSVKYIPGRCSLKIKCGP